MKIEIDSRSGFCFGVVRAIELVEQSLVSGVEIVSLGDIVHNDAEVARLESLGLRTVSEHAEIQSLAGQTVLIRAHGEPPSTYEQALLHGVTLIDATCPVVATLQRTVAQAFREMQAVGGQVVIFGRRGHAEVRGLVGQCGYGGAEAIVIESEKDLESIDFSRPIYFLAQTTGSLEKFRELAAEISHRAESRVVIKDTICRQVADREDIIGEFARRHDVVIFVAGAKSSNGKVLFEAVHHANSHSYKIESVSEMQPEWFSGVESVGICGATSTPRWLMDQVAEAMATITSTHFSSDGM